MSNTSNGNSNDPIVDKSKSLLLLKYDLKHFRDYLQEHNWVSQPPVDGLNDDDAQKFKTGNDLIAKGYASAQRNCDAATTMADHLSNVVNAAYTFVEAFPGFYEPFYDIMQDYLKNPKGDAKEGIADLGDAILGIYKDYQSAIKKAKTASENLHNGLNSDIATMNQGIQAFEGLNGGVNLDIKNLSEATLRQKLMDRESDLRDKIHTLELQCGFETAGAVGVGLVVGTVAISNFWNPIGWVAGAGMIIGEVFMGLDLKKKFSELHEDQEELAVSEEEMVLLKPLFSIKRMVKQLTSVATDLDNLSSELNTIVQDFNYLLEDVKKSETSFMKKAGKDKYLKYLIKGQKSATIQKYKDLKTELEKLKDAKLNTTLVKSDADIKAKNM